MKMNEKCAACIHCEVCGLIESEAARDGACDFYEDGKRWEPTKEEKALLQKWRDNRGISMEDFEDAMDALEQEPKFIAKSDGTIEQIKNCDDCIFRKEWEKTGELISVILKKQTEQEPCEDAISRQAVMDALCDGCELFKNGEQTCFTKCEEYHFLATLPPVTPQPKTDVLGKIRAEIETKYEQCDICEYFENYDYEENDISEYRPIGNIADILQIIDKHKAERSEK